MSDCPPYAPGPANAARIQKDGETWTLVVVKELRHTPEHVWQALTDPVHLREWSPFDADGSLAFAGRTVKLTAVGAPCPQVTETTILRAEAPHLLEYQWGGHFMRWQLESLPSGTRLTLWTRIPRPYIAMGAAGWHIALDVLDRLLEGRPIGRIVGPDAMRFGWQRLHNEYAQQFAQEAQDSQKGPTAQ